MNALLIHADGHAEVVFGEFAGDLTTAAVLTQAAISALEHGMGSSHAVQCQQENEWTTLVRLEHDTWLRVTHEPGVTVEQVTEWAMRIRPAKPAPATAPLPARIPSLADALNADMP